MNEVLIVDGYNIIGAWKELNELKRESLELARDRLLSILKEYQRFTGVRVIVVFDAQFTTGPRKEIKGGKMQVLFSKPEETADELIERLVYDIEKVGAHIYVATSDRVEQQVTFGGGALRISARELEKKVRHARRVIREEVQRLNPQRNTLGDRLDENVAKIFEKWRRNL